VERLQRVDRFDGLRLRVPSEEAQHDLVRCEVREHGIRAARSLDLFREIENGRRCGRYAADAVRWPASGRVPIVPGKTMWTGLP